MGMKGIVASTAGLAILLTRGSATRSASRSRPSPARGREREVEVAQQILQSLGLRSFLPQVSRLPRLRPDDLHVLPGDGPRHPGLPRGADAGLARGVSRASRSSASPSWAAWSTGPASRKHADIGISLPGTFEEPVAPVFVDGQLDRTLRGDSIVPEFLALLDEYVERRFGVAAAAPSS